MPGYDKIMDMQDYQRSYLCLANRNFTMHIPTNTTNHTYYLVTMNIRDFQVQAFQFRNPKSNEYDTGEFL